MADNFLVPALCGALALGGCSGGTSTPAPSGTGGTTTGSGGAFMAAGAGASGGATGTGGTGIGGTATGGTQSSAGNGTSAAGGTTGTGGSMSNTAGHSTSDAGAAALGGVGSSAGRSAVGGRNSMGGRAQSGTGGETTTGGTAGTGATSAAGAAGTATTPPSGDPIPSSGCDATPTTTSCNTQNAPCTLDESGTSRTYYVQLPDNYDPKHPYPVVFEYHPLGGNGWQGLTMYQIRPKLPNAIYVSPDGLVSGQYQGFPNTNGEDEKLTRDIMAELEGKYCVDKGRYFSTGFSYGGSMSYTAACNMSDVFRAVGVMSGAPISGATCTSKKPARPVAVWATHGDMDTALPITMAQPIIDSLVKYNGCSSDTQPVDPSPCVAYQNCMEGYPVVWCVRPGDPHAIPSFAAAAIAKFFQQF